MSRSFATAIVRLLVAVQLFIFAGVARAQTKVACVGDSITALPSSWCGILSTKLGAEYTVENFGVSGTNLAKGVSQPYWDSSQYRPSHTFGPDIVIIMLGTNDAFTFSWSGAKSHFVADYKELLDTYTSLASMPKPYIIIPTPIGTSPFGHDGDLLATEVVPLVEQVAMEKMVPTIDAFTLFGGAMFDTSLYSARDQVHPNAKGQQLIADEVYEVLMSSGDPGGTGGAGGSAGSAGNASGGSGGMAGGSAGSGGSADAGGGEMAGGGTTAGSGANTGGAGSAGSTTVNPGGGSGGSASTSDSATTAGSTSSAGVGGSAGATGAPSMTVNPIGAAGASGPPVSQAESSGCGCRTAGQPASKSGPAALLLLFLGIAMRSRKRMKPLPGNATRCVAAIAVLILWACAGDDASGGVPTAGMPSVVGGTGAGGATPGAGGAGGAGPSSGATGGTSGAAGTSGVAGMTAGGSGATSGTGGAAGMTPATGGVGGTAGGGAEDAGVAAGTGGTDAPSSSRPLSSTLELPTTMEKKSVAPFFNVWRPTDLTKVEGKLPIFVWNNGACSRNDGVFKALFEKWASGGYFVLSLTSGGGSSSTTIADQRALIDWAVAEAGMASSPYKDKLDIDHIIAGGNSCGGITSLGLASMDPRVKAVFVLSGSSGFGGADATVINGIKIPVAYVVGGEEDIARANAESDYEAFADGLPAMVVNRSSGNHLTISNDAMVMVDAADISVNWLDLTIFGLQGALDALKQPNVCAGCAAGLWTLTSKNLETLVK